MRTYPVVSPVVEIALQDMRELRREHALNGYRLVANWGPRRALNGNPEALVGALIQLGLEALTIHALAEAMPDRPVAEILAEAVEQVRRRAP